MPSLRSTCSHAARALALAAAGLVALTPAATSSRREPAGADRWAIAPALTAVVGYRSASALRRALREHPGTVVRTIPALGVAEVRPAALPRHFASAAGHLPGIDYVEPPVARAPRAEPALQPASTSLPGGVLEWQYVATHVDQVPSSILRAASGVTIAVIDTGADLRAPDIAAKAPLTRSVVSARGTSATRSATAPSSPRSPPGRSPTATGSPASEAMRGCWSSRPAGRRRRSATSTRRPRSSGRSTTARILNLSLGGPDTSTTERRAIDYAARRGALLVTAIGNTGTEDNAVEYPAALVQPVGSNGRGGVGLSPSARRTKPGSPAVQQARLTRACPQPARPVRRARRC